MALKVGDIVQLASGGMPMTINSVDGVKIECWWTEGKKQRSHVFNSAALVPAKKCRLSLSW